MGGCELRLLGRPQLLRDAAIVALPARAIGLLAFLARQPAVRASRDRICAMLWPDDAGENARHNLRQLLWSLRQAAGEELLAVSRDEVALAPLLAVDVIALVDALAAPQLGAGHALNTDVMRLYGGYFLEGYEASGLPEFEDWLLGEREYLHRLFSHAVLDLANDDGGNDARTTIELLEKLLRFDPLDEAAAFSLMSRYEQAGDRRLALRVYRSFAGTLDRELAIEPPDHMRRVAQRLATSTSLPSTMQSIEAEDTGEPMTPALRMDEGISGVPLYALVYVVFLPGQDSWHALAAGERVKVLGECHYFCQRIASRYGVQASERRGNGHLLVFGAPEAAVEFGLKLCEAWEALGASVQPGILSIRLASHLGEAGPVSAGGTWIGRGVQVAQRVALAGPWDGLSVTENLVDVLPASKYVTESSGRFSLAGDHLPERTLYRLSTATGPDIAGSPEQRALALCLEAMSLIGTARENGPEEEAAYREVIRQQPQFAEAHNNLGVILRRRGALHEAAVHYRAALSARPGYPEAHYNYAVLLESTGNLNAAIEHYRAALQVRPDYVDAHLRYAVLLVQRGQRDEARLRYERVLQLRPGYAEAHSNYAILLEDLGEREAALRHYEIAIAEKPGYAEAHYNLALFFEAGRDDEGALAHYAKALELSPSFIEARCNLAAVLFRRGDVQRALEHYRLALGMRPNDPELNYNYAVALEAVGEHLTADEYFRVAKEFTTSASPFTSTVERSG